MEIYNLTTKILVYSIDEYSQDIKKLIEDAKLAAKRAYAPYSGFRVGAAVLLSNGETITGNNQENAAYPSGLCAERVAMLAANSLYPDIPVEAIAIAAYSGDDYTSMPCYPCGSCRQTLLEIENRFDKPFKIIMYGKDKIYEVASIQELLPLSFGKDFLDK
ncbi:cytidine deaminase [Dysgonomonas sp. Marseille-P4361]|uniref:cytidine deaminase n=1 Tax=Dysgonomonas sp. Marseille-P4361 TaxID=2161820 RepID=UPI000D550BC5|nr:cytidine deaminase [Dysgonomonas sp. Marseille-P4361]